MFDYFCDTCIQKILSRGGVGVDNVFFVINVFSECNTNLHRELLLEGSPFQYFPVCIGAVKQSFQRKIAIISLSINLNMCFGCSKEPSH